MSDPGSPPSTPPPTSGRLPKPLKIDEFLEARPSATWIDWLDEIDRRLQKYPPSGLTIRQEADRRELVKLKSVHSEFNEHVAQRKERLDSFLDAHQRLASQYRGPTEQAHLLLAQKMLEENDTRDPEPLINAAFPSRLFTPTISGLEVCEELWGQYHTAAQLENAPFWRKILDFVPRKIGEPPSRHAVDTLLPKDNYDRLFRHVHGMLSDPAPDQVCWKDLDGAAHLLLSALLRVSRDDLVPIVLEMPIVGYIRTLECIQIAANRGSVGGGSRFGSLASRRRSAVPHVEFGDMTTMARDSDVGYTWNFFRDLDVRFHVGAFACLDPLLKAHFGEVESRASRDRRVHAAATAGATTSHIRGQYCDWLFVDPTAASDEAHGIEFAAAANVGASRSQTSKHIRDRTGLLVLLKDIHRALVLRALSVRPSDQSTVREEMAKVPAVGILVNRFRFEWVALSYLNEGWYGATQIKALDAPVFDTEQFPASFVAFVTAMLTFRNLLEGIVADVTYLLQAENPLESDFTSSAKWMTPASERTHKRKKVIPTEETRLSS
ncbi:hypothetical protein BC832DRAFT_592399 [Gaertneriomyces semiglobifer]|nr:hypothetical protein BC832DRAFT_592399 [Gaertneriomyces semiglobifer]